MKTRKNIVLIQCDALASFQLGFAGHPDIRTPHLDRLAAEGSNFPDAVTCAGVCVPARASVMTGRFPAGHGVLSNHMALPPREPRMGRLFSEGGYRTGYFGKTHYGVHAAAMADEGWGELFSAGDYNRWLGEQGVAIRYPEKNLTQRRPMRYWRAGRSDIPPEIHFEKAMTDRAINFIQSDAPGPFLCFLNLIAPHGPFAVPPPFDTLFDPAALTLPAFDERDLEGKPAAFRRWILQNRKYMTPEELRQMLSVIYGLIALVDHQVGRVVEALKQAGLEEETLLLFTSDHGDFGGYYGIIGKSWTMHDVLCRIPLLIRAPGIAPREVTGFAQNLDLLPTLLAWAGLPVPSQMHGKNLLPAMESGHFDGRSAAWCALQFVNSTDRLHQSMVRNHRWKYVHASTGEHELYDLENDPDERVNRFGDACLRPQVEEMRARLLDFQVAYTGQFNTPETAGFWEDETLFYDETRFCGERIVQREKVRTNSI
ncbi:MAG TPA: sulfatase-like hydrolase/transferase [Chthoniobacteraceae bacterium]|nr:sulfatase-like hydrolase/transferase [Chthoniobacteraceae bacterium]